MTSFPKKTFRFSALFRFFPVAFAIYRSIKKQKKYAQSLLGEILPPFLEENDGTLEKKDLRRMEDYALQFIAFFIEPWQQFRQSPLLDEERKRISWYAFFLCLYDDLYDVPQMSEQTLIDLYFQPGILTAPTTKMKLCARLLQLLRQVTPRKDEFDGEFLAFQTAQWESKKQLMQEKLPEGQLRKISEEKGGRALLLSAMLTDQVLNAEEKQVVYQTGAWFQLLDDLVDIDKDLSAGLQTLVTNASTVEELTRELYEQTILVWQKIRLLPHQTKKKESLIFRLKVTSLSGWIQLKKFKKLQEKTNHLFIPTVYSPEELSWYQNRINNNFNQALKIISTLDL